MRVKHPLELGERRTTRKPGKGSRALHHHDRGNLSHVQTPSELWLFIDVDAENAHLVGPVL